MDETTLLWIMIFVVGGIIVALFLVRFAMWLNEFQQELMIINTEIRRTAGSEQKRWKKRKMRLWLSILPFVRY